MLKRGTYFLFAIDRYIREERAIRTVAGAIIAAEPELYVGVMKIGSETVQDRSELVVGSQHGQAVLDELEQMVDKPGTEVTRDQHAQLHPLFEEIAARNDTVHLSRNGYRTSFIRTTDRYDDLLREFIAEQAARQSAGQRPIRR